jgi:hypothetical protein
MRWRRVCGYKTCSVLLDASLHDLSSRVGGGLATEEDQPRDFGCTEREG